MVGGGCFLGDRMQVRVCKVKGNRRWGFFIVGWAVEGFDRLQTVTRSRRFGWEVVERSRS